MNKKAILFIFLSFLILTVWLFVIFNSSSQKIISTIVPVIISPTETPTPTPKPLPSPPQTYIIPIQNHIFQTFNNCGPASLSMLLSYFDINVSQKELGDKLRPFQNPGGDNDDKSVTLEELAREAGNYDLIAFHRPIGQMEKLKEFIAQDLPVLVRTWTKPGEDIGHYRVIRGYDDNTSEIIQDDSLQNKNLRLNFKYFLDIWKAFNFEYLVLVPSHKQQIAENILGEDLDINTAWSKAVENAKSQLAEYPDDIFTRFNLSVAYFHIKNYQKSVDEFEQIEHLLPFRMLWYQIEPIQAYFNLGEYKRVLEITDNILNNYNRAFSELYILRGEIYKRQGLEDLAQIELVKATYYNKNIGTVLF